MSFEGSPHTPAALAALIYTLGLRWSPHPPIVNSTLSEDEGVGDVRLLSIAR